MSMLGYKLEERGKHLIKVDRYFASSKICSVCGHKKKELALSDRMYVCECGNRIDRDVNAAVNIREEGKRIYKECAWRHKKKIRNRINIKNKTAGHAGIACFSFALKGNRAGSPHFKIVRFKWWEHVTCFVEQIDIYREESYFRFFKYIRVHFSLYFKERETWKLWNNSECIFEKDQGITIKWYVNEE